VGDLRNDFDVLLLSGGAEAPRDSAFLVGTDGNPHSRWTSARSRTAGRRDPSIVA